MDNSINVKEIEENKKEYEKEIFKLFKQIKWLNYFLKEQMRGLEIIDKTYNNQNISTKSFIASLISSDFTYEKIKLQNVEKLQNYNKYISSETEELLEKFETLSLDKAEKEKSLEMIARYISKIKRELAESGVVNPSSYDIYSKIQKTMEDDKNTGYEWLYGTPILKNGKTKYEFGEYEGDYLEFFNESSILVTAPLAKVIIETEIDSNGNTIEVPKLTQFTDELEKQKFIEAARESYIHMKKGEQRYTEFYKNKTLDNIEYISLADIENWSYSGMTWYKSSGKTHMSINLVDIKNNFYNPNYVVDIYNHELGHVFDNAIKGEVSGKFHFSECEAYHEVRNQIDTEDPSYSYINAYGHQTDNNGQATSHAETFAESCGEFYGNYDPNNLNQITPESNYNSTDLKQLDTWNQYDPSDLAKIEIVASGDNNFTGTYYEYMEHIMNGEFSAVL